MNARTTFERISLVVALTAVLAPLGAPGASAGMIAPQRSAMFLATNGSRAERAIRAVDLSTAISTLARQHSLAMAEQQDLFHTEDPAGTYLEGMRWRTWGENVGVTGGSVADLQAAFMRSAGHRANILNPAFKHVAIGAVRRDGILWVTIVFWG